MPRRLSREETADLDKQTGWSSKQRNHLRRLIASGATIAYVCTDRHGRPSNGGPATRECADSVAKHYSVKRMQPGHPAIAQVGRNPMCDALVRFMAEFPNEGIRLVAMGQIQRLGEIQKERPCRVCSRPNDLGVKTCWMCGVENPGKVA